MKKLIVTMFCVFVFFSAAEAAEVPAWMPGVGVYGSVGNSSGSLGGGVGVSLAWDNFPVVGLQWDATASRFNASVDYYAMDKEPIAKYLTYFLGAGVYGGFSSDSDADAKFDCGLRIPGGLQFWPLKKLELYGSPVVSVPLYPSPRLAFGVEFGGRLRF